MCNIIQLDSYSRRIWSDCTSLDMTCVLEASVVYSGNGELDMVTRQECIEAVGMVPTGPG